MCSAMMMLLQVVAAQAALPAMTVPYTNSAVNRPMPAIYQQMRAKQPQPFAPYMKEAPRVEYIEAYAPVDSTFYGPKKVGKPARKERARLAYDKSRTPGADSYVKEEAESNTYGRYGVAPKENPERLEGARYGSGYGPKPVPGRKSTAGIKLDEESADQDSDSVMGITVAMLLGMIAGSSITYIVARPRFVSKKMGSPEPLLVASV
eukprot:gnl/MRDRNA2_/MRDRNA2_59947_c0_seq1.p1 gnl/MRDRNA2_/MRDRNA2_59947_c0~~gnl/MRDRNA2_/MRDRNA2_59947_c0_seq1.p1  ORF type:complete len:206 (-),score=38.40 gnl/MRDRNA2_/MRDRNA2_59947_c0_seq1:187-804(-)